MRHLFIILLFLSVCTVADAQSNARSRRMLAVDTIGSLRDIKAAHGQGIMTFGDQSINDRMAAIYRYDTSITAADNGFSIIRPRTGEKGGWRRIMQALSVSLGYGISYDATTNTIKADSNAIETANHAAQTYQPKGAYLTSADITGKKDKSDSTAQAGYVTHFQDDTAKRNEKALIAAKLSLTDTAGRWQPLMALSIYNLPAVTLTQTATTAIAAGIRKVTVSCTGLQVGDRILLTPTASTPAGYGIHDAVCVTAGSMEVSVNGPLLAIGSSYSFICKVTVFR